MRNASTATTARCATVKLPSCSIVFCACKVPCVPCCPTISSLFFISALSFSTCDGRLPRSFRK